MPNYATFNQIYKNVNNFNRKKAMTLSFAVAFVTFFIVAGLIVGYHQSGPERPISLKRLAESIYFGEGEFANAAVSADGLPCPTIGSDVLEEGGTAIDSAIATLFCLGVVNAQSMGLGGGFFLTYYNRQSQAAYSLDARETAPEAAHKDMYNGNGSWSKYGGLAVAVPGEVRGYWEAYQRFGGGVTWSRLVQPTIDLCDNGYPVNRHMAKALAGSIWILEEPSMSVFVNPKTGKVWKEGDLLKRPNLARTLRILQQEPDAIYNGSLTETFLTDLKSLGSIISRSDLVNYRPIWREPSPMKFGGNYTLYSTPPPGSGLILGYILRILQNYNFTKDSLYEQNITRTYQRIAESFKFAYAKRTELGDMDFSDLTPLITELLSDEVALASFSKIHDNITHQDPSYYGVKYSLVEDSGTSHISIVSSTGDAVAVTSTINLWFGAKIMSQITGIVLNDEMDDFSVPGVINEFNLPPFEGNYIQPGKRPVSSMCPSVVVDEKGDVRLVIGAAGGTRISSSVAWTTIHNMWLGLNIKDAIDIKRMHHQLYPMELSFEKGFDKAIIASLEELGHMASVSGASVVTAIERMASGGLRGYSDARKGGGVDGF